jgi:hypothetical protein
MQAAHKKSHCLYMKSGKQTLKQKILGVGMTKDIKLPHSVDLL